MAEPEKDLEEKQPGAALATEESSGDSAPVENTPYGPPATRGEVWSYYAYFAANNGIGSFQ